MSSSDLACDLLSLPVGVVVGMKEVTVFMAVGGSLEDVEGGGRAGDVTGKNAPRRLIVRGVGFDMLLCPIIVDTGGFKMKARKNNP